MLSEKVKQIMRQNVERYARKGLVSQLQEAGPALLLAEFQDGSDHPLDREIVANREEAEVFLAGLLGMM